MCKCRTDNNNCSRVKQPMCANDGRTYNTECEMKLAGCRRDKNITKLHDGECRKSKASFSIFEFSKVKNLKFSGIFFGTKFCTTY